MMSQFYYSATLISLRRLVDTANPKIYSAFWVVYDHVNAHTNALDHILEQVPSGTVKEFETMSVRGHDELRF